MAINLDTLQKDEELIKSKKRDIKPRENGIHNEVREYSDSTSYLGYLTDGIASAVLEGPLRAVNEFDKVMNRHIFNVGYVQIENKEGEFDLGYITPNEVEANNYELLNQRLAPQIYKPDTGLGEFSAEMSKFIIGFIGPNKYLKGVGLGGTIVKAGLRGMTAGAVADLTMFDPHEGNLSNLLIELDNPLLNNRVTQFLGIDTDYNPVTQFLAIDEDDTDAEGRLKLMLEGLLLGGVLEVMMGLRAMRNARKANNVKAKEKIIKEQASDPIADILNGTRSKNTRRRIAENNGHIDPKVAEEINIKKGTTHEQVEGLMDKLFNTASFTTKAAMRAIDDVIELFTKEELDHLVDGVLTDKAAKSLAKVLSEEPETVIKGMGKTTDETSTLSIKILAAKSILQRLGSQLSTLSSQHNKEFVNTGNINKKSGLRYEASSKEINKLLNVIKHVSYNLKRQIKDAATATQKGGVEMAATDSKIINVNKIDDLIDFADGDIDYLAKAIAESDDIDQVIKIANNGKWLKATQSLYINNLLSSYWTQGVNMLMNAYTAIGMPGARILGGTTLGLYQSLKGNSKGAAEYYRAAELGMAQFKGMLFNSKGMWKEIWKSLKSGDPTLDRKVRTQDYLEHGPKSKGSPISGEALELDGLPGTIADWFGNFVQLPSRALVTGDEFFKQLNYRGSVYSNALDLAFKRNIDLTSKKGKKFFQDILDGAITPNGKANVDSVLYKKLYQDSLDMAREATFQLPLKGNDARFAYRLPVIGKLFAKEGKSMGENIEDLLGNAPGFRFLMPFVRTPTNLWRQSVEYTPILGMYTKRMDALYRSGPQGRADVMGRQMIGTSMVFVAWDYMNQTEIIDSGNGKESVLPKMTGAGPKDYATRKLWLAAGWQPYSILVKATREVNKGSKEKPEWVDEDYWAYRQYNRMDPRFFHWGIMADMIEVSKFNPQYDAVSMDMAGALITSIVKNIGDKSYTKGVGDLMQLLEDPSENKFSLFMGKQVSNFAPYNTFAKQFKLEAKDFRSFSDRVFDSLHIADLEPKRDFVGKPITRAATTIYTNESFISSLIQAPWLIGRESELDSSWWKMHIMALSRDGNLSLSPPTQYMRGKQIDLASYVQKNSKGKDQTALDYWREQMGTLKRGNRKTLEEALESLVLSKGYEKSKTGTELDEGKKETKIEKEYNKYKKAAFKLTLKKYPQLAADLKAIKKVTRSEKRSSNNPEETIPGVKGSTLDRLIVY